MPYATSDETKKRLLKTMARLLRTQGYYATGVSQVLEESEVPKGSLYYHFPDGKTQLAAAAVSASREWIMRNMQRMIEAAGDPVGTVTAFCDSYIELMESGDYTRGCPIATITLEAAGTIDPIQVECKQAFTDIRQLFTNQLHEHGVPLPQAENLAVMATASIEGALIMSRADRDPRALILIRDNLRAMFQAALPAT